MRKSKFLTLSVTLIFLFFISACSSDDGDSNPTEPGNGDNPPTVSVEPITVPQKMQDAANNGNPGAAQAVAYIQIANTLPSYTQFLTPPEGASKISSTTAVTGEWTWTQDGATITLVTNETATSYEWTVTVDGTFGGKTYSNQLLLKASELRDGSSIQSLDLKTGAERWTSPRTGQNIVFRDSANPDSPGAEKFAEVVGDAFDPTSIFSGESYDAAALILLAMQAAGSSDPGRVPGGACRR